MAQAVSRRPLTAEDGIRARVSPLCGICGGQSGTETGFSPSWTFPYQYHLTVALHSSYITWGMSNRPVSSRSSETSLTPSA